MHLQIACEAAQAAREIIQTGFGQVHSVNIKADQSIVTASDEAAEKAILDILRSRTDYSILSEECGLIDTDSPFRWVIDPIDGTTNFSRGQSICAVSIALMREDELITGVIDLPIQKERYTAVHEHGAFLNDSRIHVSKISHPSKAILCVEHGRAPEDGQIMAALMGRLNPTYDLRLMGSTAYEMASVASGQADAFISCGDKLWDYAAGLLIIREAGGKIMDWQGQNWQNKNDFIFASNGLVDNDILPTLSDLQSDN
ncbi:inositol monophosphatase [candidate division KSB1 bacterium]|nr:inositol monophosphatase [candidate division KSB1 bacterium]